MLRNGRLDLPHASQAAWGPRRRSDGSVAFITNLLLLMLVPRSVALRILCQMQILDW